jgi:hemerythrin-like domain-containing protein
MNLLVRAAFRTADAERMREQLGTLLEIVRRHLAREEQLLFNLARQALPTGEREHAGAHWAQFRGVTLPE